MYIPDEIYTWFKASFEQKIKSTPIEDFKYAWSNGLDNKTLFFKTLFSDLIQDSTWLVQYEHFRCDIMICDQHRIPLVFIETENMHRTASTEVQQLCCLHAPLKVLFISCSWHDSQREKWLHTWQSILRTHHAAYPSNANFCIVIGEWGRGIPDDGILRFYLLKLAPHGAITEDCVWELQ